MTDSADMTMVRRSWASRLWLYVGRLGSARYRLDRRQTTVLSLLSTILVCVALASLGIGAVAISPGEIVAILGEKIGVNLPWDFDTGQAAVLVSIRVPRIILGIIVGAGLAVSGAAMQGLFRNPLADPALIGVSSGAALAAVLVIVLGTTVFGAVIGPLGQAAIPLAAFIGGFGITLLVYRLSRLGGATDVANLLLAGIAINAIAGAATGLVTYMADDQQLRTLTFWAMGSLGGATWHQIGVAMPFLLAGMIGIPLYARALNVLLLGEAEAGHLGFPVERLKQVMILLVALAVGASVALTGVIGFVGLMVPHLLRLWTGPDHRLLLPGSALLGASLLLVADLLARTLVAPAELPIGIITTLVGGPFFLWLLIRKRNRDF